MSIRIIGKSIKSSFYANRAASGGIELNLLPKVSLGRKAPEKLCFDKSQQKAKGQTLFENKKKQEELSQMRFQSR
ncbi:MAG: hypothetical protein GY832_03070 [Chloroflexi bacterium]|nr:hypothetical protein [Chloroflexota bacterium]